MVHHQPTLLIRLTTEFTKALLEGTSSVEQIVVTVHDARTMVTTQRIIRGHSLTPVSRVTVVPRTALSVSVRQPVPITTTNIDRVLPQSFL